MFSGEHTLKKEDDMIILDRNPIIFSLVIDYLRNDWAPIEIEDVTIRSLFELEIDHWDVNPNNDRIREFMHGEIFEKLKELANEEPGNAIDDTFTLWEKLKPLVLEQLIKKKELIFNPCHF